MITVFNTSMLHRALGASGDRAVVTMRIVKLHDREALRGDEGMLNFENGLLVKRTKGDYIAIQEAQKGPFANKIFGADYTLKSMDPQKETDVPAIAVPGTSASTTTSTTTVVTTTSA